MSGAVEAKVLLIFSNPLQSLTIFLGKSQFRVAELINVCKVQLLEARKIIQKTCYNLKHNFQDGDARPSGE